MWRRLSNLLFAIVLLLALAAGAGSLALGRPVLATVIKSNSMSPLYQRGDVAFVWNWPGEVRDDDIVLFKPSTGSLADEWTMHRVVGQDETGAFLTQGDAAQATDQEDGLAGPVAREEIYAKALALGGMPLKLPWVGNLALRLDINQAGTRQILLGVALVVLVAVGLSELIRGARRRRRGPAVDPRLLFVGIGAVLSILLVAMTLNQTIRIMLRYEVGPDPGVLLGQPVGIITPGQVVERDLSTLSNEGFMPMILLVSESDPNIFPDAHLVMMPPGARREVKFEVRGNVEGSFNSPVEASMVFPLLPLPLVAWLAGINHWLAALAGCFVPGLLVIAVGSLEPINRRRTARDLRLLRRRLAKMTPR